MGRGRNLADMLGEVESKEGRAMARKSFGNGMAQTTGAFALGAALGSLATLLYAPTSGRVIRKRINQKFQALQTQANRRLIRAKKVLVKQADMLRDTATDKIADAREWVVEHMPNGHAKRPARHRVHHA